MLKSAKPAPALKAADEGIILLYPMSDLSKKQKKHLRELTNLAYERDLSRCLEVLESSFKDWKNNEITVWDLNQVIHEYHNEIARDLYKSYTMNDPVFSVAFGLKQGVISLQDIEENCRDEIISLYELFSRK